jgi:hypothetical protein
MARWIRIGTAGASGAGSAIEGCVLKYECAQRWERLEVLRGAPEVRFCNACRRAVHWAADEATLRRLARQGKCVAFGGDTRSSPAPAPAASAPKP